MAGEGFEINIETTVLVVGGLGYIGSHVCVTLLENKCNVIVVDNLSNSDIGQVGKIEKISGREIVFYENDIADKDALRSIFQSNDIDVVINLAAYKSIGDSLRNPICYYANNLITLINLLEVMDEFQVHNFIFSSSASVYKAKAHEGKLELPMPYSENDCIFAGNPYARSKSIGEEILYDVYKAKKEWKISILRYFNPVGAHSSGVLYESPSKGGATLFSEILQVAAGTKNNLLIYGGDYETPDRTAMRDYIHVMDLANAHYQVLRALKCGIGFEIFNIGTGRAYSVKEVVNTFSSINHIKIPYHIVPRREGDVAYSCAEPRKANMVLGWKAELGLPAMCQDAWQSYKKNVVITPLE